MRATAMYLAQQHSARGQRPARAGNSSYRVRRIVAVAIVGAFVAEAYFFRHRIGRAFADIQGVNPWWAAVAVIASLVSMNCFARTQRRMLVATGSPVSVLRMVGLAYAANAVNWTFPGGTALSAGYVLSRLRGWGVSTPAAAFTLAASAVFSSVTFVGLTVVCAVLTSAGSYGSAAAAAALALLLAAVTAVWRRPETSTAVLVSLLARINRVLRRPADRGRDDVRRFLGGLTSIRPRRIDWITGSVFALLNWIADLLCLVASCQAVDLGHPFRGVACRRVPRRHDRVQRVRRSRRVRSHRCRDGVRVDRRRRHLGGRDRRSAAVPPDQLRPTGRGRVGGLGRRPRDRPRGNHTGGDPLAQPETGSGLVDRAGRVRPATERRQRPRHRRPSPPRSRRRDRAAG